jgi:hypothetical protein
MRSVRRLPHDSRGMTRALLLVAAVLSVLLTPGRADAYTWMIRHSYAGCGVCHADPSGGEVLTPYGRAQSDLLLRTRYGGSGADDDGVAKSAEFLGLIALPDPLLLGGSARIASVLTLGGAEPAQSGQAQQQQQDSGSDFRWFPMQLDMYGQFRVGSFFAGGSVGLAKVDVGSPHARAAQVTTGQGKVYNLLSRNHYVGMDFGEGAYTARLGRLNLPFGIRIPEHTMWVRDATRTDRDSDQQHGIAVAYNSETVRAEGMAILGNYQINPDSFRERGYSFYVELMVASRAAFGVSSLYTYAKRDRLTRESNVARGVHGAFSRISVIEPLVLLVEADLITDSTKSLGYTGFLQGDYEIIQGLHAIATGEILNAGRPHADKITNTPPTKGAGELAVGGWLGAQWFFLPHFDMRVDGIFRPGEKSVFAQLHLFL